MVPEVLVSQNLKTARRIAQRHADALTRETGCSAFTVVAEFDGPQIRTAIAESESLEQSPEQESFLLKSAVARIVSLLVLQFGRTSAFRAVMAGFSEGVSLAVEAQDRSSASG